MNNIDYEEIGARIRSARKEQFLSQEALAEKCDISPSFMGHIERGSRKMSLETFVALASELNLSTDYLLSGNISDSDPALVNILHTAKRSGSVQYEKYITIIKALAEISDKL